MFSVQEVNLVVGGRAELRALPHPPLTRSGASRHHMKSSRDVVFGHI